MTNPYAFSKNHQRWRRAVSDVPAFQLDPTVDPRFIITSTTRVGTAGSCFAQHIAKQLVSLGFNYFVPESGLGLPFEERVRRNFGVFSARYGNIYTTKQLLQLFEEAVEGKRKYDKAWRREDGRFVDPFRPLIEPDGFADAESVQHARSIHLQEVARVFAESELFVFTLGLTEGWRSRVDGSAYAIAPGVSGGSFSSAEHEPFNQNVEDALNDLNSFINKLRSLNPNVKVLLTVSPVPLAATFEERHVLCSTTYSKSVLRVVADEAMRRYSFVDYFPSYEIITSSRTAGQYYNPDAREINHLGVSHAMRSFINNFTDTPDNCARYANVYDGESGVVCDEATLELART